MNEKMEQYFICEGALTTTVCATNIEDGIILAKARALEKGYIRPKTVSVKLTDCTVVYYCADCGSVPVEQKGNNCGKCNLAVV